jgi:hypothetical protein
MAGERARYEPPRTFAQLRHRKRSFTDLEATVNNRAIKRS